jgi:SAM-dependent methyltransferase
MSDERNRPAIDPNAVVEGIRKAVRQSTSDASIAPSSSPPSRARAVQAGRFAPKAASPLRDPSVALPRWRAPHGFTPRTRYTLGDFLALHDVQFVDAAYLGLLGRPPDAAGREHHLDLVRSGKVGKTRLLGELRYSPEGRQRKVEVRGLRQAFMLQHLYRVPVLGYLISWLVAAMRLPMLVADFQQFVAWSRFTEREIAEVANAQAAATETALREQQAALREQHAALANKADASVGDELARLMDEEIQRLAQALGARMDMLASRQLVDELARDLSADIALRAPQHELIELRQHTDQLLAKLAATMITLHEQVATWPDSLAGLRGEWQRGLDQTAAAIAAKADAGRLAEIAAQLVQQIGGKADTTDLHAVELALRTARADHDQLRQHIEEVSRRDMTDLHAVELALRTARADHDQLRQHIEEVSRRIDEQRRDIAYAQVRLDRVFDRGSTQPVPAAAEPTAVDESNNMASLDAFYVAFEDHFRGTRELIRARAREHLPVVRDACARTGAARILDIGCGRGEWLELLAEEGLSAYGVDLNAMMVAQCRVIGLDVHDVEALTHLRQLPADSLAAVTGFHIVEHVPFRVLVALFDECLRVLRPGGIVLFETPNPENLTVGACTFYMDPSHLHPLPPALLDYLAVARGFASSQIHRLNKHRIEDNLPDVDPALPGAAVLERLLGLSRQYLFSAPDYAVVARKD